MSTSTWTDHVVLPSLYRDSVALMLASAELQRLDGVIAANAAMATPANREVMARSGLLPASLDASPDDLIVVVEGVDQAAVARALAIAVESLAGQPEAGEPEAAGRSRPATLAEGIAAFPEASVVCISVAGAYVPLIAKQALAAGRHVFCFSDNVAIGDEVELKRYAVARGLLLMGPDCGTALIDGTPLGFVNAVLPGPVGIVAASGTGAQEVMSQLDAHGVGVSQVIGVGGRDLTEQVGATMTHHALDLLEADEATGCIVLVGKPPDAAVAERLLARLEASPKPVVACLVGGSARLGAGSLFVAGTLESAAREAARRCGAAVDAEAVPVPGFAGARATGVIGLFAGGTLASEARHLLDGRGVAAKVVDLGDDEYTVGRPHPMIDPTGRNAAIVSSGGERGVGTLLLDVVLGHGAMADPAAAVAEAVTAAKRVAESDGRDLTVIASVCGTARDPQGIDRQRQVLQDAGILVAPSNAAAAQWAAASAQGVA